MENIRFELGSEEFAFLSRVEGTTSRVEGNWSRVGKCSKLHRQKLSYHVIRSQFDFSKLNRFNYQLTDNKKQIDAFPSVLH